MTSAHARILASAAALVGLLAPAAPAQTKIRYGEVAEGEFTENSQEHRYTLPVSAGDKLRIAVQPVGETLHTRIELYGPSGLLIQSDPRSKVEPEAATKKGGRVLGTPRDLAKAPVLETAALSARGNHVVVVRNLRSGGVGQYKLSIGAVLRDGTEVNPGDAGPEAPAPEPAAAKRKGNGPAPRPNAEPARAAGPGLPPQPAIDLSGAVAADLGPDGAASDVFSAQDKTPRVYHLQARAHETFDLTLTRTKGFYHLGVVVLSPTNEVLANANLLASDIVSTRLTLPIPGKYTIGVYRVELGKPAGLAPSEFELKAKSRGVEGPKK